MINSYRIFVTGTVQGVGFRPFIYLLAQRYLVTGTVSNNSKGVEILLNADTLTLQQFLTAIEYEYPPLATIDKLLHEEIPYQPFDDFKIIETQEAGEVIVNIPPDVGICSECEKELFDPHNYRYKYPFIACTHCGVRYSIIYDLPYDREYTSMKFFKMCDACEAEYNNPLDRRYHAQPIGCHDCGPKLQLVGQVSLIPTNEIDKVVELLTDGSIIAVKGVGGYHLMCDATNEEAITKLRERKRRSTKPFAVMVRDMEMAKVWGDINPIEEKLLCSKERPIVIVGMGATRPTEGIAPLMSRIGLFLPYTPLHLLLLDALQRPLVATSANVTDEPICTNVEELEKL
ncbi:MAG: Sua5/YciO/YrdC/YwlC family protein, partial [Sulfurovum sp.]|nr:Sua5/YciO/YrdC/YwlC family protein [Sulfurovum sp.]